MKNKIIYIILLIYMMIGCRLGWRLVDENKGMNRAKVTSVQYSNLPDEVQDCYDDNGEDRFQAQLRVCDSTHDKLDDFFVVSADYNGFPLRKMGVYIKFDNKKFFIKKPVGNPVIIDGRKLYYTRTIGARYEDDSIKSKTVFYCFAYKKNEKNVIY